MDILRYELKKIRKNRFFCLFLLSCAVVNTAFWLYQVRGDFSFAAMKSEVYAKAGKLDELLQNGERIKDLNRQVKMELEFYQAAIDAMVYSEEESFFWKIFLTQYPDKADWAREQLDVLSPEEANRQAVILSWCQQRTATVAEDAVFLNQIEEQARKLQSVSLFSSNEGSVENWVKTQEDYQKRKEIPLTLTVSPAFDKGTDAPLSDILLCVIVFLSVSLLFVREYKDNSRVLIYSQRNGRMRAAAAKTFACLIVTGVSVIVVWGMIILASLLLYGTNGIDAILSSSSAFRSYSSSLSNVRYLLCFIGGKVLGFLCLALLTSALMNLFASELLPCLIVLALWTGGYLLRTTIPDTSPFAVLRYLNFYFLIDVRYGYTHYRNLKLFGVLLGLSSIRHLFWFMTAIPLFVITLAGWVRQTRNRKRMAFALSSLAGAVFSRISANVNLLRHIVIQLLFTNRAIFLYFAGFLLYLFLLEQIPAPEKTESYVTYQSYLQTVGGALTDEKGKFLEEETLRLSSDSISQIRVEIFRDIQEQYNNLKVLSLKNASDEIGFVDQIMLKNLFGNKMHQRLLMLLATSFQAMITVLIFSVEEGDNRLFIRSQKKGRYDLFLWKSSFCVIHAVLLFGLIYGIWLIRFFDKWKPDYLDMLLQCVAGCEAFPFYITIRQALIFLFLCHVGGGITVAAVLLLTSSSCRSLASFILALAVVITPQLAGMIGLSVDQLFLNRLFILPHDLYAVDSGYLLATFLLFVIPILPCILMAKKNYLHIS